MRFNQNIPFPAAQLLNIDRGGRRTFKLFFYIFSLLCFFTLGSKLLETSGFDFPPRTLFVCFISACILYSCMARIHSPEIPYMSNLINLLFSDSNNPRHRNLPEPAQAILEPPENQFLV